MNFGNTKEIEELIIKVKDFFMTISDEEKKLNAELIEKENIQIDLLHEIELAELNAIDFMKVAQKLKKNRHERRKTKDELGFINTLKGYTRKFTEKGIIAESEQLLKNIETYKKGLENRYYIPKVLNNLKCAKKD